MLTEWMVFRGLTLSEIVLLSKNEFESLETVEALFFSL